MKDWKKEREEICQQIEYDYIVSPTNREQLDELVEIIVEIELNRNPITRIGKDAEYPSDYVRQRMRKLTSEHTIAQWIPNVQVFWCHSVYRKSSIQMVF